MVANLAGTLAAVEENTVCKPQKCIMGEPKGTRKKQVSQVRLLPAFIKLDRHPEVPAEGGPRRMVTRSVFVAILRGSLRSRLRMTVMSQCLRRLVLPDATGATNTTITHEDERLLTLDSRLFVSAGRLFGLAT